MDDEEADLLRQRDLQRLQTMERYCQTTECLRNYILAYFGEHPTAPCGNCGSCNNDFDEVDMTDAAKWMINCVAELRGRYGKAILFGTLQGANRARLRELGAERFKSYGRMKDTRARRWNACWPSCWRMGIWCRATTSTPCCTSGILPR